MGATLTTAHRNVLHRVGVVDGLAGLAATAEEAELGLGRRG